MVFSAKTLFPRRPYSEVLEVRSPPYLFMRTQFNSEDHASLENSRALSGKGAKRAVSHLGLGWPSERWCSNRIQTAPQCFVATWGFCVADEHPHTPLGVHRQGSTELMQGTSRERKPHSCTSPSQKGLLGVHSHSTSARTDPPGTEGHLVGAQESMPKDGS